MKTRQIQHRLDELALERSRQHPVEMGHSPSARHGARRGSPKPTVERFDVVEEASKESFPASDAPAW